MVTRTFWVRLLEESWKDRSVLWLYGVRRAGKTFLSRSLPNTEYFDCELPRVRRMLDDPEAFLEARGKKRLVLDEIHRLENPAEILKIAADHYPRLRVLATGSSTLGASRKFRDTLAGRKRDIFLTPMALSDLKDFGNTNLKHRLLRGGLPPFFLSKELPERDFQEWMDAYWAKDIQELFRLERRASFQRFLELILGQSGGIFEASRFAVPCEVSRPTISNYLSVLDATSVATVVRPFSTRRSREIVAAPKVYAFDTGFVCYFRGWHQLRADDLGPLWEHFVLNEISARLQRPPVFYWRDKQGHELDFVLRPRGKPPIAIECKWSADHFEAKNLASFRGVYPEGENFVVASDIVRAFKRELKGIRIEFVSLATLVDRLERLFQRGTEEASSG